MDFFKKMSISPNWIESYLRKIWWADASRPCEDEQLTISRNRKLIRDATSNECFEHKCVDLSDYRIYLNQMLYRAQASHY